MRMKTLRRSSTYIILGILTLAVFVYALVFGIGPRYLVSEATTIETGPLRSDGTVDYVKVWNEKGLDRVPPDQNALVTMLPLLLPLGAHNGHVYSRDWHRAYANAVGIPAMPTQLPWRRFSSLLADAVENDLLNEEEKRQEDPSRRYLERYETIAAIENRPWRSSEFPLVRQFLDDQALAMDLFVEASFKQGYFAPRLTQFIRVSDHELRRSEQLDFKLSSLTRLLQKRVMNRIAESDFEAALNDIQAIRRMGRLVCLGQPPGSFNTEVLSRACYCESVILASGGLTAQQLKEHARFIREFANPSSMGRWVDFPWRRSALDSMQFSFHYPKQSDLFRRWNSDSKSLDWKYLSAKVAMYKLNEKIDRIGPRSLLNQASKVVSSSLSNWK